MFASLKNLFTGKSEAGKGTRRGEGGAAADATMANFGLDAARYDEAWGFTPWPIRPNDEWDGSDLMAGWKRARQLYVNNSAIRAAVENMVRYIGVLSPLPTTQDAEWNELALAAWRARTKNPHTFDLAGRVNYRQAMRFCERSAIIDGDICVVPTFTADKRAAFSFYRAHQVAGGGMNGVEADRHGRATAYHLTSDDGQHTKCPAWYACLYQHHPDPTRLRGYTMLAAALRNAHDLAAIIGYSKQGVKLASSMGLITTKTEKSNGMDLGGNIANARGRRGASTGEAPGVPGMPSSLPDMGLSIHHLPVGWDIKAISDTRPSQQLQAFFAFLVRCVAQAVGLDPEMLFTTNELSSAATRFSLEKLRRFQDTMAEDQEVLANRMWRHVIACEIATGHLRPCMDEAWMNVRWVPERDMTIDAARIAQAHINLVNECMADNEDYTLRTTGQTPYQLARRRAKDIADLKAIAAEYGLTLDELRPRQVGAVPATSTTGDRPAPLPDDDPEQVPDKPAHRGE